MSRETSLVILGGCVLAVVFCGAMVYGVATWRWSRDLLRSYEED